MDLASVAFVASFLLLAPGAVLAQGPAPSTVAYVLGSDSQFETGCFGPCACPILGTPLTGTFDLTFDHSDPLFEYYRVTDVRWSLPQRGGTPITGSGTYRVGGEVAVQQQMILDLTAGSQPVRHFDSGL